MSWLGEGGVTCDKLAYVHRWEQYFCTYMLLQCFGSQEKLYPRWGATRLSIWPSIPSPKIKRKLKQKINWWWNIHFYLQKNFKTLQSLELITKHDHSCTTVLLHKNTPRLVFSVILNRTVTLSYTLPCPAQAQE